MECVPRGCAEQAANQETGCWAVHLSTHSFGAQSVNASGMTVVVALLHDGDEPQLAPPLQATSIPPADAAATPSQCYNFALHNRTKGWYSQKVNY